MSILVRKVKIYNTLGTSRSTEANFFNSQNKSLNLYFSCIYSSQKTMLLIEEKQIPIKIELVPMRRFVNLFIYFLRQAF